MKGLQGKNVLITGASSGIGQAIAFLLATEGCNIAINYRKSAKEAQNTEEIALQKACGELANCGVRSLLVQGDVSREEDIVEVVNSVVKKFGSLDLLINNAGIQAESASHEVKTEDFDRVINVNLRGSYLCARETIKHFLSQNRPGVIINVPLRLSAICGAVYHIRRCIL